jgi:hypothetical protein
VLRWQTVDDDFETHVGGEGDAFGNAGHDRQGSCKAGDRRLAMIRERVIGSGRYAGNRR